MIRPRLKLVVSLLTGFLLLLPLSVRGQDADTTYSIIAQLISREDVMGYVLDNIVPEAHITLIAGDDTLRTSELYLGGFEISGIKSKDVTLSVVAYDPFAKAETHHPYSGTFELRPGANAILITTTRKNYTSTSPSSAPIMTFKGGKWVYRKADLGVRRTDFVVDMMVDLPGVEYNARKGELTISGDVVHCQEVGSAYHFWQDRNARE